MYILNAKPSLILSKFFFFQRKGNYRSIILGHRPNFFFVYLFWNSIMKPCNFLVPSALKNKKQVKKVLVWKIWKKCYNKRNHNVAFYCFCYSIKNIGFSKWAELSSRNLERLNVQNAESCKAIRQLSLLSRNQNSVAWISDFRDFTFQTSAVWGNPKKSFLTSSKSLSVQHVEDRLANICFSFYFHSKKLKEKEN